MQFLIGQATPRWSGHVEDAERLVLKVEWNAGVIGEPVCEVGGLAVDRGPQPAAFQDVNVLGRERTLVELCDAPALVPGHAHLRLQVRRRVPRRRVLRLT